MRFALATCRDLPEWEVDDTPLHGALADRGVDLLRPAWDDPVFDWGSVEACLIRTTWDYMERRSEYLDWIDRVSRSTRLYNSAEIVRWNTHKSYLQDLEAQGVPTLPTCWLEAGSDVDLEATLRGTQWKRAFLKPAVGATARETLRFDADPAGIRAAEAHLARVLPHEDMMLQPYQESVERQGETSMIVIDGEVTHAVRKVPVPGDYRVQDDFGAHDEAVTPTAAEIALAHRVVAAVRDPDLLYARADFLRDPQGDLRLIELELVEPSLFFRHGPQAAVRLAEALIRRVTASQLDDTLDLRAPSSTPLEHTESTLSGSTPPISEDIS